MLFAVGGWAALLLSGWRRDVRPGSHLGETLGVLGAALCVLGVLFALVELVAGVAGQ